MEKLVQVRDKSCSQWKEVYNGVAYVCVARAASTTVQTILNKAMRAGGGGIPHDHTCTLQTLEERGATKVLVALRHPIARISSGIARRFDRQNHKKQRNQIFLKHFSTPEDYISALRDEKNEKHSVAIECTMLEKGQNYMTPLTEFYLQDSLGIADIAYLCINSLIDDAIKAFDRWNIIPRKSLIDENSHTSLTFSSSNLTNVYSRFSPESISWLEKTYAADIELFERYCGPTIKYT